MQDAADNQRPPEKGGSNNLLIALFVIVGLPMGGCCLLFCGSIGWAKIRQAKNEYEAADRAAERKAYLDDTRDDPLVFPKHVPPLPLDSTDIAEVRRKKGMNPDGSWPDKNEPIKPASKVAFLKHGMSRSQVTSELGSPTGQCILPDGSLNLFWDHDSNCAPIEVEFRNGSATGWSGGQLCGKDGRYVRKLMLEPTPSGFCKD